MDDTAVDDTATAGGGTDDGDGASVGNWVTLFSNDE